MANVRLNNMYMCMMDMAMPMPMLCNATKAHAHSHDSTYIVQPRLNQISLDER